MPVICPSITAYSTDEYHQQVEKVARFAQRIHIDLMDGRFTKKANVTPEQAWWPVGFKADFHLMYKNPDKAVRVILQHRPNLIIVHAEADGQFARFADTCHRAGVKVGVALLQQSSPKLIIEALPDIDHVLIFSGDLGEYGGRANLDLLKKAAVLKQAKPSLEIGWDGGINDQNLSQLAFGGVDVLNVGGYLQKATDPERVFQSLQRVADETGTT